MSDAAERLVLTTQELLWERGYGGTSPRAIQDRAGVGQGSMYHHFRSKADLALAAEKRSTSELIAEAERVMSGPEKPLERVVRYLRLERAVLMGCRTGMLTADPDVIATEALRAPLKEAFDALTTRISALLREAQEAGQLDASLDAHAIATTTMAVRQGGYVLARAAGSTQPYEEAIEGIISLIEARAIGARD